MNGKWGDLLNETSVCDKRQWWGERWGAHLFQIEIKKQQDGEEEESISQNITTDSDIENHRLSGRTDLQTDGWTDEEQSQMVMMTVMIMTFIPPTNRHRHRHQNSMAATSTSFAMLFLLAAESCRWVIKKLYYLPDPEERAFALNLGASILGDWAFSVKMTKDIRFISKLTAFFSHKKTLNPFWIALKLRVFSFTAT